MPARGSGPKNLLPMQPGDVHATYADIAALQRDYGWQPTTTIDEGDYGWQPTTTIDEGLPRLVAWYREYYGA